MTKTLVNTEPTGNNQIATKTTGLEGFQLLDPRSATGVAEFVAPRTNFIATISAGYKKTVAGKGGKPDYQIPARSENGEIYVHGEAPYLEYALKQNDQKSLTVMFPSNKIVDFVQQRYTEYSASSLLTYGDGKSVIEIKDENRVEHLSGTPAYAAAISRCKVSVSVFFFLAKWKPEGADMIFQDGLGLYRLHFTSKNSMQSILWSVEDTMNKTGTIVGIPFDLFLRKQEHADGTGKRRPCWIWQCITRPPEGITLDARTYSHFAQYGLSQVSMMKELKAPEPETIEDAISDVSTSVDLDAVEGEVVSHSPEQDSAPVNDGSQKCDESDCRRKFFAITKDTGYATEEARHAYISWYTKEKTNSLTQFLKSASAYEAREFFRVLEDKIESQGLKPDTSHLINKEQIKKIEELSEIVNGKKWKEQLKEEVGGWVNFKKMSSKDADIMITDLKPIAEDIQEMAKEAAEEKSQESSVLPKETVITPSNVDTDGVIEGDVEEEVTDVLSPGEDDDPFADA